MPLKAWLRQDQLFFLGGVRGFIVLGIHQKKRRMNRW
jgi:hypothetical protein